MKLEVSCLRGIHEMSNPLVYIYWREIHEAHQWGLHMKTKITQIKWPLLIGHW